MRNKDSKLDRTYMYMCKYCTSEGVSKEKVGRYINICCIDRETVVVVVVVVVEQLKLVSVRKCSKVYLCCGAREHYFTRNPLLSY